MAKILVFQHVAAEPLGNFDPLIRASEHRIRYINFSRDPDSQPNCDRYDALIVLGGPMMPDQQQQYPHLRTECRAIEHFIANDKPVLGICLGSQLIAHTLGARVFAAPEWEVGWYPLSIEEHAQQDPLLCHYPDQQSVFQWHGYTFDLPDGARRLASSLVCMNQAYRYGQQAWGFQFHLELDQRLIKRWLSLPEYLEDIRQSGVKQTSVNILEDTERYINSSFQTSQNVFGAFLDLLPSSQHNTIRLPSR